MPPPSPPPHTPQGPCNQHLALPLLLLTAQQRNVILLNTRADHIKFLVELYDKCQETCQQYADFLKAALGFDDYARWVKRYC